MTPFQRKNHDVLVGPRCEPQERFFCSDRSDEEHESSRPKILYDTS